MQESEEHNIQFISVHAHAINSYPPTYIIVAYSSVVVM
jgi:hypothetical protein